MTNFKIIGAACALAVMSASAAVAAPMAHEALGASAPITDVAMMRKGSRAGMMKQRHRTRTDRCRNKPSRC